MLTATKTKPVSVGRAVREFRNGLTNEHTILRYFVDRSTSEHVVVRETRGSRPVVFRHDSIDEARQSWRWAEKAIVLEGFTRVF